MTTIARIVLADRHAPARRALRLALEQQPGYGVVAEAQDVAGLLALVQGGRCCPNVLVIDPDLRGLGPTSLSDLVQTLQQLCPSLQIVALGIRPEDAGWCHLAGIEWFVCKSDPPDGLLALLAELVDCPGR